MKKLVAKKPPRLHEGSPEEQWKEYCKTEESSDKKQLTTEFGGAKLTREETLPEEYQESDHVRKIDVDENNKVTRYISKKTTCPNRHWYLTGNIGDEFVKFDNLHGAIKLPPELMSKSLDRMPYGIIDKQITGIGATTLEIKSERDSIIVVPTKALAKTKTNTHGQTFRLDGSVKDYQKEIKDYLEDTTKIPKKFIVVADSLYKLPEVIGAEIYDKYFILIDEIDMVQADSTYREVMGDIIDYYFLFDPKNRALVSATVKAFSNPLLQKEPFIKLIFEYPPELKIENPPKRKVYNPTKLKIDNVIVTKSPNGTLGSQIEQIRHNYPNDKIVIAYNSATLILETINMLLPIELQDECAILCGENSKVKARIYFKDLDKNCKLPKSINFITSAYFAGVDFQEKFHLIIVANSYRAFTLVSIDQIIQISGRCRLENGIYSTTIIHDIDNAPPKKEAEESYKQKTEIEADAILNLYGGIDKLRDEYSKYDSYCHIQHLFDKLKETVTKKGTKAINKENAISLTRKDIFGDYQRSYFNIDTLINRFIIRTTLYNKHRALFEKLVEKIGDKTIKYIEDTKNYTAAEKKAFKKNRTDQKVNKEYEIKLLEERIVRMQADGYLNTKSINKIRGNQYTDDVLCFFKKLYPYIEPTRLISELSQKAPSTLGLTNHVNALTFWTLADDHPFKVLIFEAFNEGATYSPKDILAKMSSIFSNQQLMESISNSDVAVKYLKRFFNAKRAPNKVDYVITHKYSDGINTKVDSRIKKAPKSVHVKELLVLNYK